MSKRKESIFYYIIPLPKHVARLYIGYAAIWKGNLYKKHFAINPDTYLPELSSNFILDMEKLIKSFYKNYYISAHHSCSRGTYKIKELLAECEAPEKRNFQFVFDDHEALLKHMAANKKLPHAIRRTANLLVEIQL